MGKTVDITEKLDLNAEASLIIAGKKINVNSDAATVLKIMDLYANQKNLNTSEMILKMYDLIFDARGKKAIEGLHMTLSDLQITVEAAAKLIMGSDDEDEEGEDQTHTTT